MKPSLTLAAAALVAAAAGCAAPIELQEGRFVARTPDEKARLLVYVAGSETPILGEQRRENDALIFVPRFPLRPGLEYRAVLDDSAGAREAAFRLPPPPDTPPTTVRAVFPSADRLPENLLKFYVHFSAPMSRGDAYRHVRLLDAAGKPVELPFLEIGEELWDPSSTRLTLLFDPGRIKRGLKPREDSGPTLEEGKSYTLVVDPAWPDASGKPLAAGHRKTFAAVPPDDVQPDPKRWTLSCAPEALTVAFEEPLDEAMLHRSLVVLDPQGKAVEGRIEIDRGETRWRFRPAKPWGPGTHALRVDAVLEDRCGNSLERPFEVDIVRPVERRIETRVVSIPFTP